MRAATQVDRTRAEAIDRDNRDLLWLLSDSNLPTGGFVASSGLEAYYVHGFLHRAASSIAQQQQNESASSSSSSSERIAAATVEYVRHSLVSYASSALPFLLDAHRRVQDCLNQIGKVHEAHIPVYGTSDAAIESCLQDLEALDGAYHSFALNHVLRRASKAQGMALLTLYSKSFSQGLKTTASSGMGTTSPSKDPDARPTQTKRDLIEAWRRRVRLSASRNRAPHAHLPICWGMLTAALSLNADETASLHLFLQARAIISSSIRLNTVGPYMAHSLLFFELRSIVKDVLKRTDWVKTATSGLSKSGRTAGALKMSSPAHRLPQNDFERDWSWEDEGAWVIEETRHPKLTTTAKDEHTLPRAPVNQWPLGEIIQGRHDVLHSRLFNS